MNSRQRVKNILDHRPVDKPAVQYYYTDVGAYEHGEKLNDLFAKYPGDFGPFARIAPPVLDSDKFEPDGRYYEVKTDAWGTVWEHRIYGRMGHAIGFPIPDKSSYKKYEFPLPPDYCGSPRVFVEKRKQVLRQKEDYMVFMGEGYAFLDRLIALRGFENAMSDLIEDGPEVNLFLDDLADYFLLSVRKLLGMGADCISFGDDYGSQNDCLLSPLLFKKTIAPRLARLMKPIREAGRYIYFHSCGQIKKIFSVLQELGVDAIWPQLPLYDMDDLAAECRTRGFALAIHTDRAFAMTSGTPDTVRALVRKEAAAFKPREGGGWFYIEVDHGFPFENIVALVEEIYALREEHD